MAGLTWLPIAAAMLAATVGGTSAVATRLAIAGADPTAVAAVRYVAAAALMLAFAPALGARPWRIQRGDLLGLGLLGVGQFALFGWLFTAGYAYIPAARGALILSAMPLLTLLIAAAAGREALTRVKLGGVALGAAGVALALGEGAASVHPQAWKGDLMLFAAAVMGSLYNVFAPAYLHRYGTLTVTALGMAIGAVAFVALFAAASAPSALGAIDARGWVAIAYLAVIGGAGNFLLWLWALERSAPTRVAIVIPLNPLAAALLGAWLLDEPAGARLALGLVAVGVSIWLVNRRAPERAD